MEYTKWVACWGNATSITDRRECVYAKDITLRYPVRVVFAGSKLRIRFSNLTGTETVTLTKVNLGFKVRCSGYKATYSADAEQDYVADFEPGYLTRPVTFGGKRAVRIEPGCEVESDEMAVEVTSGEMVDVSIYLGECTQMNAGTLVTGPLSHGQYAYGDFAEAENFPPEMSRKTNWFYFLNTIDVFTSEQNRCVVCYGDSITAQSWPDYLADMLWNNGHHEVAVIRRAVSGTRILRQYDCITYQAYGLMGAVRFPIEMNTSGMSDVIIQHGINDIIHPVGTEVNPFRPWSDMPTLEELEGGVEHIYVDYLREHCPGVRIWSGTLLPILGWRTYNTDRERMRESFNEWLRHVSGCFREGQKDTENMLFDGCIDFDAAVRDPQNKRAFAEGNDSGDHLHPSEQAYSLMAEAAMQVVF